MCLIDFLYFLLSFSKLSIVHAVIVVLIIVYFGSSFQWILLFLTSIVLQYFLLFIVHFWLWLELKFFPQLILSFSIFWSTTQLVIQTIEQIYRKARVHEVYVIQISHNLHILNIYRLDISNLLFYCGEGTAKIVHSKLHFTTISSSLNFSI